MKKFIPYIIVVCFAILLTWFVLIKISNHRDLPSYQRWTAESILASFEETINSLPRERQAIVDYDSLLAGLSFFQRMFVNEVFSIDPAELGFKGPFYSKDKPGKLVKIESVPLGKDRETGIQYLPEHVYNDYLRMIDQMKKDTGRQLFVDSGYRSPGRQAYLFFKYLVRSYNFSLEENAKWIAMPGYSEHGHPINTAIDFTSEDGINGFSDNQTASDFIKLPQYKWLLDNASKFNFYLSYPENNKSGAAFEPWHWHWKK